MTETLGRLGYVGPMAERPINHPGNDPAISNLIFDWRDVPIRNARELPGGATSERNGFTTLPHRSAIEDWEGAEWKDQFGKEVLAVIKDATGASDVVLARNAGKHESPFLLRSTKFGGSDGPLTFCHNDYTGGSAPRHIAKDYPERRLTKRFAIYNLWRLISPPPQSWPLALCDPTSIAVADLVPAEARFGTKDAQQVFGENTLLRYNPAHRWYYFPDLRVDETLVWCGYDSDPAFPSIVPHGSFQDPSCRDPAACRTNVHGAVYAFFDD